MEAHRRLACGRRPRAARPTQEGDNVERQRVSIFRQKNSWGLTALSIGLCVALSPVLGLSLFLPQTMTLMPVLLLLLLGYVGPVSAAACSAVFIALAGMLFGGWGALCAALLLVPVVLVSAFALDREHPFWVSAAAGCTAMFVAMSAVIMLLSALAGNDVVTAISGLTRRMFESSGAIGDAILSGLVQMGIVGVPESMIGADGQLVLDAAARAEMVSALVLTMDTVLRLELPMQMATGSVAAGLLGQAVLRKGMLRRGEKVEYPPLRTWRVPKGWGRVLGGTLAALFVLAQLAPSQVSSMFYVFSGVFDQVFALQGIAAVCYMLHKRGKSRTVQGVVFALGYFVLSPAALMIGIADQGFDFTHRREELAKQENPFDPRANA